ncbi:lytic murein transglycosylase [Pseudomonas sp. C27(2019)]|uniref:lytic murein transglycosylase n=1 Tax=Pseudomonas sp. C27(2019) TaxID=2604941 RepID=UPI00124840F1|nr:lytic murein transglycosylase [Pseudomonas sp. C27(2019)]QEY59328.1 lytic murein transglycosylase [Pseudomonas sp. C27(2019)]
MLERLFSCFAVILIGLFSNQVSASSPAQPMAAHDSVSVSADTTAVIARQSFADWRADLRTQAISEGVSPLLFEQVFAGLTPDPQVISADQSQPEFSRPVWEYLDSAVSSWRVARGKALLAEHAKTLQDIEARYQVEPSILVAVWGMESSFGRQIGSKSVIRSLATLAYEGRRNAFWRSQLIAALQILEDGDISSSGMIGSWAGAMGQTQFMPTTYRQYAVDFTGDGRRDIWSSSADALASAANYLSLSGWQHEQPWGFEVQLPARAFDYAQADGQQSKTLEQWFAAGLTARDPVDQQHLQHPATLFLPSGYQGPAYLLLDNFRSILKYNNSSSYALAIGLLSNALNGDYRAPAAWPKHDRMLSRTERVELQTLLNQLGFPSGQPDGIIGVNSRQAVRSFQQAQGLPADGYTNEALLEKLRQAAHKAL